MKVSELLEFLNKQPAGAEVLIGFDQNDDGPYYYIQKLWDAPVGECVILDVVMTKENSPFNRNNETATA